MQAFIPRENARGFIMPNFIFENRELNCGAKLLFSALCDYARDKAFCFPSKKRLARQLNISLNTLKARLRQLISLGFVKIQLMSGRETFYLFYPNNNAGVSKNDTAESSPKEHRRECLDLPQTGVSNFDSRVSKIDTEVKVNNLKTLTPPISPTSPKSDAVPSIDCGKSVNFSFEDFWGIYPKKENKEKARKAYWKIFSRKKIPNISIFQKAVEFFLNTSQWQKESGRFIPQLHNFLNDLRWEEIPKEIIEKKKVKLVVEETNFAFENLEERQQKRKEEEAKIEAEVKVIQENFDNFSSYFSTPKPIEKPLAYGLFMSLFRKGMIPKVTVPQSMNIVDYLVNFKDSKLGGIADGKSTNKKGICKS